MTTTAVPMSTRVYLRAGILLVLLAAIFSSVSGAQSTTLIKVPQAKGLPILFAHGWCGDPTSWAPILLRSGEFLNTNLNQLYPVTDYFYAYYNSDSDQVNFESSDGTPVIDPNIMANARLFVIKFRAPNIVTNSEPFDPLNVANTPILVKADQLAHVIRTINAITGSQKSIVIGHSMGGLVARGYIEGLAAQPLVSASNRLTYQPGSTAYGHDVRAVITLDTPNDGSLAASGDIPLIPSCVLNPSVTKDEMETASPFIGVLDYHTSAELCVDQKSGKASSCQNGVTASLIDSDLPIRSIVSFVQDTLEPFSDGVLLTSEQNIKNALQKHYLEDGKFPKRFDSRSNVFAEFPNSDACTPIHDLGSGLHGLPCLASQQQTTTILLAAITSLGINPTPNISNLFPSQIVVGAPATLLTISGQQFMPGAAISINGQPQSTQFISSTELTTMLASSLFHTEQALDITVSNPQPSLSSNPKKLFVRRLKGAPPVAGFTITSGGQSIIEGGTLSLEAQVAKPVSVTFSADRSAAQKGFISAWQWKIDNATVSTENAFVLDLGLGTHLISLVVMDSSGLTSLPATATIVVSAAPLSPLIFFDGSIDPQQRFFFAAFQPPITDSQGNLLVISTHFGFSCPFGQCGIRANSISPVGVLNWQTPNDSSFISFNTEGSIITGQSDQIFIPGFAATLFSLNSAGSFVPRWPVPVGPQHFQGPIIADQQLGTVYASGATTFSFSGFPATIMAINPDGTVKWQDDFPNGGRLNLYQGPNRDLYTLVGTTSGMTLLGLDHGSGVPFCNPTVNLDSLASGPEGLFGSLRADIVVFDANCNSTKIFSSTDPSLVVAYADKVIYALNRPNPNDAAPTRLFAITNTGTFLWIDSRIQLPAFQVAKNGFVYLFGQDIQDNFKSKIFVLNSMTGQIVGNIDTETICTNCTLAITVADDGTLYATDENDAKIFRLN